MRVVVCPDVHAPYHDKRAWDCFLESTCALEPSHIVIIGDFLDCYPISQHLKDPRNRFNIEEEIAIGNACLDDLGSLSDAKVIYCEGNHEDRLPRYLSRVAPELAGVVPNMPKLLRIAERGWKWVPYHNWTTLGKMAFTHEVGRSGVNAARQSLQDFGGNIIFGHSHRGAIHYAGSTRGERHVSMNVGWLGDVNKIDYRHKALATREWQHGFGVVDIAKGGLGWCTFVPIVKGQAYCDGRRVG